MADKLAERKKQVREKMARLELRIEAESKLKSGLWQVGKVTADREGNLTVSLEEATTPGVTEAELVLPKDRTLLPPTLANEVRQAAWRANEAQAADTLAVRPYEPGLELAAPDDRTVRAVTHPRTHPDAAIGHGAIVHPTATVDAHAEIGRGAQIGRHAHVCPRAEVDRMAVVGSGTEVPHGARFHAHPSDTTAKRQAEWEKKGAATAEWLDGSALDRLGSAGLDGPPDYAPGDSPAPGRGADANAADSREEPGTHMPPPVPDRGAGHGAEGETRQQGRSAPAR